MVDIFDTTIDNVNIEIPKNYIKKGAELNLLSWDPSIKNLTIGLGWDVGTFEGNPVDVDISCFLLNKNEKTRVNEDFVFYNNLEACEGAVIHNGDNRVGAGDGDDESISIRLQGIPFDILRIVFVISIYRGDEKEEFLSKLRGAYIRIINADNELEVVRYDITPDLIGVNESGMIIASLDREGPKWFFRALGQPVNGGLAKMATNYDIIVQGT